MKYRLLLAVILIILIYGCAKQECPSVLGPKVECPECPAAATTNQTLCQNIVNIDYKKLFEGAKESFEDCSMSTGNVFNKMHFYRDEYVKLKNKLSEAELMDYYKENKCILIAGLGCSDLKVTKDKISLAITNNLVEIKSIILKREGCADSPVRPLKLGDKETFVLESCNINETILIGDILFDYTGSNDVTSTDSGIIQAVVE